MRGIVIDNFALPGAVTGMTTRPIIFSAPMVRALLAGRKTQTRRLATSPLRLCEVGDRLWVREAWRVGLAYEDLKPSGMGGEEAVFYKADSAIARWHRGCSEPGRLRVSLHMPRWASRLTLTVTDVRVEPLQAISEADAIAEGPVIGKISRHAFNSITDLRLGGPEWRNARDWYADLWDSLHTREGERWEDNPTVVALTFSVEQVNIDRMGELG